MPRLSIHLPSESHESAIITAAVDSSGLPIQHHLLSSEPQGEVHIPALCLLLFPLRDNFPD